MSVLYSEGTRSQLQWNLMSKIIWLVYEMVVNIDDAQRYSLQSKVLSGTFLSSLIICLDALIFL